MDRGPWTEALEAVDGERWTVGTAEGVVMIRVVLPQHLRTLAGVNAEVLL